MIKIDESTPCKRTSPNAVYHNDILVGTAQWGQPFKGRVAAIRTGHAVLKNGYGGAQWCRLNTLKAE